MSITQDQNPQPVDAAVVPRFAGPACAHGEPASYSFVLRGYVRHWLGNVWAEYDRINLNDIVAARAPTAAVAKVQLRG